MKKELGYLVLGGVLASVLTGGLVYAQTSTASKTTDPSLAPCHQGRGGEGIFGKMDKDQMLKNQAEMLGMTQEELQTAIDSGQRFDQIAESKGITQEQMQEKMQTQMKAHLSELVAVGTITQAQMDEHLERMANKPEAKGFGMMHGQKFGTKK
ncbi:MAG: hypothetical protein UR94_C0025G0015 [Parcubacteria group bacterium GW2011_GWA2_36_10]|nr:MAG: hypothetical protein UR94_C0025G0015 [Parcubacteria group bacterium GW2011_GWA2_36_10]